MWIEKPQKSYHLWYPGTIQIDQWSVNLRKPPSTTWEISACVLNSVPKSVLNFTLSSWKKQLKKEKRFLETNIVPIFHAKPLGTFGFKRKAQTRKFTSYRFLLLKPFRDKLQTTFSSTLLPFCCNMLQSPEIWTCVGAIQTLDSENEYLFSQCWIWMK